MAGGGEQAQTGVERGGLVRQTFDPFSEFQFNDTTH